MCWRHGSHDGTAVSDLVPASAVHRFNGYIHVKAIPGADPELIERVGFLADRMSVNLELPTADGLARLAPGKTRDKILRPMRQIEAGIAGQLEQEGRLESRGA